MGVENSGISYIHLISSSHQISTVVAEWVLILWVYMEVPGPLYYVHMLPTYIHTYVHTCIHRYVRMCLESSGRAHIHPILLIVYNSY